MQVKCVCGEVFDYEENRKVCPKCKKFYPLPDESKKKLGFFDEIKKETKEAAIDIKNDKLVRQGKKTISTIKDKEKESLKEDNTKIKNNPSDNKNLKKKESKKKKENDIKTLFSKKEIEWQDKSIKRIVAIFIIIVFVPALLFAMNDSATKINGSDGTIISRVNKTYPISSAGYNLTIEKMGYTNKGKLYVQYSSNIYGFAEMGYSIEYAVLTESGNIIPLAATDSDFDYEYSTTVDEYGFEEESYVYTTRAMFNYTNKEERISALRITITTDETGYTNTYTYNI